MFSIPDGSFNRFKNSTVKLSAKETKWTSLEVRTHSAFLETLISKYDFVPVKLRGLWRNGPPKPYFEIKVSRKVGRVLSSNEVNFVSLADTFTVQFSNLLKLTSGMENKTA